MEQYEVELWPNTKKMRMIFTVFGICLGVATVVFILSWIMWDSHTYEVRNVMTGVVSRSGWPVSGFYWGGGFAILGALAMLIMKLNTGSNQPSAAINAKGLFINQQLFKNTFVTWEEIGEMKVREQNDEKELLIKFKDTESIIKRQSGIAKPLLRQTYVKDQSYLGISNDFSQGDIDRMIELAMSYYQAVEV